jgi:hypothetical protein
MERGIRERWARMAVSGVRTRHPRTPSVDGQSTGRARAVDALISAVTASGSSVMGM